MDSSKEHRIREQAYHLWEKEGEPHGREHEFWERARLMVESAAAPAVTTPLQRRTKADKAVDEAVKATFPASDPPSSNPAPAGAKAAKPRAKRAIKPPPST